MRVLRFSQSWAIVLLMVVCAGCTSKVGVPIQANATVEPETTALYYDVPLPPNSAANEKPASQAPAPEAATAPAPGAPPGAGAPQFVILHTNDTRGYVDPCG